MTRIPLSPSDPASSSRRASRRVTALFFVLALCSMAPAVLAQKKPATSVLCHSCGNRGEIDCKKHKGSLAEYERSVLYCSEATACKKCQGALTIDCKICTNKPVEQAALQRRELARTWLAERQATLSGYTRGKAKGLMHCKGEHVDLTFSAQSLKIGRRKLNNHQAMHVYLQRLEKLRADFVEVLELRDSDFPSGMPEVDPRLRVYVFKERDDQVKVAPRVTGQSSRGPGVKLMGINLAYSVYHDRSAMKDDEAMYRNLVHNVSHLILSGISPVDWIGNKGAGWIDEGLAHYFEYRVPGKRCMNFCYQEVSLKPGATFKNGFWRVAVRKMVEEGKFHPFVEIYQKNSEELDFPMHAQSFAYVEFLIAKYGGAKFRDFVAAVKAKVPVRDAMKKTYKFGPLQFDERFVEWVRATYPMKRK